MSKVMKQWEEERYREREGKKDFGEELEKAVEEVQKHTQDQQDLFKNDVSSNNYYMNASSGIGYYISEEEAQKTITTPGYIPEPLVSDDSSGNGTY